MQPSNSSADPLDLAALVRGKQVSAKSSMVKWLSGHTTVVPFLPDEKGENTLLDDEYFI